MKTDWLTSTYMVATLAIAVFYNERNCKIARENQALSREQFEYIKKTRSQ